MIESQRHSFHLVDPSPWPISGSLGALATTVGGVMYMHSFQGGATLLSLGLIFILYTMFVWWRDVLRESTLEGHHTKVVQLGLRYGFILFIVSEVMFFFAFFWAFFHSSLAPAVEIGGIWPPKGIWGLDLSVLSYLILFLGVRACIARAQEALVQLLTPKCVFLLMGKRTELFYILIRCSISIMSVYSLAPGIYGPGFDEDLNSQEAMLREIRNEIRTRTDAISIRNTQISAHVAEMTAFNELTHPSPQAAERVNAVIVQLDTLKGEVKALYEAKDFLETQFQEILASTRVSERLEEAQARLLLHQSRARTALANFERLRENR